MSKKVINQNVKFDIELINSIEPRFKFSKDPINRLKKKVLINENNKIEKKLALSDLSLQISSIEDCSLKKNAKKIILGSGNINSPLMLIGEAPNAEEDISEVSFGGAVGDLLKKMLNAIDIDKENVYLSYAVNFRPPNDRKPTTAEIKRYSFFLQKHISIIDPKIIILMGSTSMESLTGLNSKISEERGKWKEIIIKNNNYPVMITFNPSYLLRYPENKKYSWDDLKKIKEKIKDLNITI
jgi:uracil-DNA glycosylase